MADVQFYIVVIVTMLSALADRRKFRVLPGHMTDRAKKK